MNEGNYEKACPLLRDSQKADPQPGTQLNLALCYEKLGKSASAWSTYSDLTQTGGPLQQQAAKAAVERLAPKLSRLRIDLCEAPNFDANQLTVRRNGEELGASVLGRPSPVDPGEYRIEARVPGFEKWQRVVRIAAEADLQSVEICQLEPERTTPPLQSAPPASGSTEPSPVAASARAVAPAQSGGEAPHHHASALAFVAVGTSATALIVGTVFGIAAANKKSDASDSCSDKRCSSAGLSQVNSAKTSADISTVSFVVAGVAAGLGAYLFLEASPSDEPKRSARLTRVGLQSTSSGLALSCSGAF